MCKPEASMRAICTSFLIVILLWGSVARGSGEGFMEVDANKNEKFFAHFRKMKVVERLLQGAKESPFQKSFVGANRRNLVWHATLYHGVPSSPNPIQNQVPGHR